MIQKILSLFHLHNRKHPGPRMDIVLGNNSEIRGKIDKRSPKSKIVIGQDCLIGGQLVTETDESQIMIGNNVFVGGGTLFDCVVSIRVEDDVLISYNCILADSDNHSQDYEIRKKDLADWRKGNHDWSTTKSEPIVIGKGAWIGARAIILKGVKIGEGAIVGAGSVVTKEIPAWSVAAGNPARVIKKVERTA